MSGINNIGGSPSSGLQPLDPSTDPTYLNNPTFKALPAFVQQDLIQAFSTQELNAEFPNSSSPTLANPSLDDSMSTFFKLITEAKRNQQQQLAASDFIDQATRSKSSQAAALQAASLADAITQRNVAAANTQAQAQQAINELQQQLNQMQTQQNGEESKIQSLNNGNGSEKSQFAALTTNYNTFITAVKKLPGVIDNGNGYYTIPKDQTAAYNSLVATYQGQVNSFNSYWGGRLGDINTYNSNTNTYNSNVSVNNQYIQNFINQYNLNDSIVKNNVNIPTEVTAGLRNTSGYSGSQSAPGQIPTTGLATIYSYPPPSYAYSIASYGPPAVQDLPTFPTYDAQQVYPAVYSGLYKAQVQPLDNAIALNTSYWSFLSLQILHSPPDSTPDPLLNFKPIARRILQPTIVDPVQPNQTDPQGAGSLSVEVIGLSSPHIQGLLAKASLAQAVENLSLNLTQEQKTQLVNQLLILSTGLISTTSLESLFPSLGPIADLLANLPKDSPAISLLFSIAFSNSIQEAIGQGLTLQALQTLIQSNPLLQNLTPQDLSNLATALNVGLLLVAAKLLEANLGVPGLLASILPSLLPPELQAQLLQQVGNGQQQNQTDLVAQLQAAFINQGFTPQVAAFLANFAVNLNNQGLLTPNSPVVSPNDINQQLLLDSIKANLLLGGAQSSDLAQQPGLNNALNGDLFNPVNQNVDISNPNILNNALNGDLFNPVNQNVDISNPNILNNALNGDLFNPVNQNVDISNPNILNDSLNADLLNAANQSADINNQSILNDFLSADLINSANQGADINRQAILNNSLNADLIASNQVLNLIQADAIAREALQRTFAEESNNAVPVSANQFKSDLQNNLIDLGVSTPIALSVAREAVIIPRESVGIPPLTSAVANTAGQANAAQPAAQPVETPTPSTRLSREQLLTILEQLFPKLVLPHLGEELTRLVTLQLANTLYGTPNPDSRDLDDVKSPLSLINTLQNQLYHLNIQQDTKQATAITDAFKETLLPTTDFYAFSLKVMDPAFLFIYSGNTGIMYSGISQPSNLNNWKRSIDIAV
ncbi:hypothetical protein [Candidatus Protochlamydia phocaeensis]|uniref:hypothetical protein n=1 Tax=Candidatus Protochlamydia phocaeensis TaxID=1414722 RepID=UPI0008397BEA|nr:hypothetical protein [Candidatus Protochlamydia phocaeensis]